MARKKTINIDSLIPDDKNFNQGTDLGAALMKKSFTKFGAGRSIVVDKNNKIIAGNKSAEAAAAAGVQKVQIIESDGTQLIAIKRTDIDLDTPKGREMALADNVAAKENIIINAELVEAELGVAVLEEYNLASDYDGMISDPTKSKKENLEPFKKTHVLLSFNPQVMLKIQKYLQLIIEVEGVEYEQSSN